MQANIQPKTFTEIFVHIWFTHVFNDSLNTKIAYTHTHAHSSFKTNKCHARWTNTEGIPWGSAMRRGCQPAWLWSCWRSPFIQPGKKKRYQSIKMKKRGLKKNYHVKAEIVFFIINLFTKVPTKHLPQLMRQLSSGIKNNIFGNNLEIIKIREEKIPIRINSKWLDIQAQSCKCT